MTEIAKYLEFDALLEYLKANRGFDFTGYKRTSLMRRIHKRMGMVGIERIADYIDHLEVHPDEFSQLFNTILINVTGFFRDPQSWEYLDQHILPRILNRKKPDEQIRIWSVGCASGEEAYTITMLMAEHLGIDAFKERVKVYATDLDEDALARARLAVYQNEDMEAVPEPLRDKYFERSGSGFGFTKDLRRCLIFGRHDLVQDAPISRIDLLVCRNTLMYFNAEAQTRILARLNYALTETGYLFLGKAEMLLTHINLFTPVDLKHRVFSKAPSISLRDRLLVMAQNGANEVFGHVRLRDAAYDSSPYAQLVVDTNGYLVLINERARNLFHLSPHDLGRLFQDLEISYRPVELRSSVEQAYSLLAPVTLKDVEIPSGSGELLYMNVLITPLAISGNGIVGVNIAFIDVTEHNRLQRQFEQVNQELETAMEELRSTNEELESTNEELQSTNEELETMNEELQSTNEELETMNDEMTQRSAELNNINSFLESILTNLRSGVVVIDSNLIVQVWNRKSEDLWGLRADEVRGHNFFSLDIGLPVDQLKRPIRAVLSNETDSVEVQLPATNRREKSILCDITCIPLMNTDKEKTGVIMVVELNDHRQ